MSQAFEKHKFTIDDTMLVDVDKLAYLGSKINANSTVNSEVSTRFGTPGTTTT